MRGACGRGTVPTLAQRLDATCSHAAQQILCETSDKKLQSDAAAAAQHLGVVHCRVALGSRISRTMAAGCRTWKASPAALPKNDGLSAIMSSADFEFLSMGVLCRLMLQALGVP